jgi:DNA-binding NarL/FixJ family response regulator
LREALEDSVCTEAGLDRREAGGLRLLVVSHICLVREVLAEILKSDAAVSDVELSADLLGPLALNPAIRPDAALLDAALPDGLSKLRQCRQIAPNAPTIIAFGLRETKEEVIAWAEAGAAGYIPNTVSKPELIPAIKAILAGEQASSRQVVAELLRRIAALASIVEGRQHPSELELTERERQIAELIMGGLSDKEIARRLNMSLPTVKLHVHHLLRKLNLQRRSQVILRLRGLNIISQ